jgi:hypothetical protein
VTHILAIANGLKNRPHFSIPLQREIWVTSMSSEFRKGLEQAAAVNFDPRSDCVAGLQKLTSPFRASSPENLICHSYSRESELQIILLPRLDSPDSMSEDEGDVEPITMTASTFDIVEMDEAASSQHKSLEIHGILQQIDEESDAEGEDRLQRVSPVQPIIHGKVIHRSVQSSFA